MILNEGKSNYFTFLTLYELSSFQHEKT